ncbi:MAG: response regulator [Myxococcota bacterium]
MSTCVPPDGARTATSAPLAQSRVDAWLGRCADPCTPPSEAARLYLALASEFCLAGGTLDPADRLRILLSDDVTDVLDIIEAALHLCAQRNNISPLVELRCVRGGDGLRTLDTLRRERFSLVALDVDKPGLSGPEVVAALRSADVPWRSETQAVLVTAYADCRDYERVGVNGHLKKPFRARDIRVLFGHAARDRRHLAALRRACLSIGHTSPRAREI